MSRHEVDVCVVGAGQSGLAVGYHLQRLARTAAREDRPPARFVLLDDRDRSGGAWSEGWDTLALFSPPAYSSLPGRPMPPWSGPGTPGAAHVVAYLDDYERRYDLPVHRPVAVTSVEDLPDERLLVRAGAEEWVTSVLVNATGTWSRPFWPHVQGAEEFTGRQLHTADYRGVASVRGPRVAVVGGGNSGAQIAADLLLHTAYDVLWCAREPPAFLPDDVDGRVLFETATRAVQALARGESDEGVQGLGDVVAVPSVRAARDTRGLRAVDLFDRLDAEGACWADGTRRRLDTVVWCTGFRPDLGHLRGLDLPRVGGHPGPGDPRVLFVGYGDWTGPASATLIGVNTSARRTAREAVDRVARRAFPDPRPAETRPAETRRS